MDGEGSNGVQQWRWEWCTGSLEWIPYDGQTSSIIERAFHQGVSSIRIRVNHTNYTVSFNCERPRQKNFVTKRKRPVRRQPNANGGVVWQWWNEEMATWDDYQPPISTQIENQWNLSKSPRTSSSDVRPAGLLISIGRHQYSIKFESDALQTNDQTKSSRQMRRCLYSNQNHSESEDPSSSTCIEIQPFAEFMTPYNADDSCDKGPHEEEKECTICLVGLDDEKAVTLTNCKHSYHEKCIQVWFNQRQRCPQCLTVYGVLTGNQPSGEMHVRYLKFGSGEARNGLPGYPNTDVIRIYYSFPDGIQTEEHPNPGKRYGGTQRVAYLPKNQEGEEVLELLKTAWNRRLLFQVGTSVTTGRQNVVTWAGIHHKTRMDGGPCNYGYPDETYLTRVKMELRDKEVF